MSPDAVTLARQLSLYKGLVEVSALINGITESAQLLPAILDVGRRVLNVEAASLFLVNSAGELELAAVQGRCKTDGQKIVVPPGRGIAGWVFQEGVPLLVADAYSDPRFYAEVDRQTGFHTRSILCVPLLRDEASIGVLQMLNPGARAAFEEADLEVFQAYGNLAATAIEKLRTVERQREQDRVAQEFAFAREIQTSFLPQTLPQRREMSFAAAYRPARNVGGDFYDVVETGPDELYFVIGDVSGKGIPAALLMAQALSILRLIIQPGIAPDVALARWNAMLSSHAIRGMFITALVGRIVVGERRVEIANAGHCAPFRVLVEGRAADVPLGGSPPLGILPELACHCESVTLAAGEWLVLFTDGLTECFSPGDCLLDRAGVAGLLGHRFGSASDVIDALNSGELQHRGNAEPHDDLTALVFGFR